MYIVVKYPLMIQFYSSFNSGALDIYNCRLVEVRNTVLQNNRAESLIRDTPFRSNAGGIAIGINRTPYNNSTSILVDNCTFIGNQAKPVGADVISTSDLFKQRIFAGRGGGVGLYIQENSSVSITIQDCYFERNYATTFGGGVYIVLDGEISNHSIQVIRSVFVENQAGDGGGGLHIGFLVSSNTVHSAIVTNCTLVDNLATFGGGSYVFPGIGSGRGYSVCYKNCTFEGNVADEYGAALGLLSVDFFEAHSYFNPYVIEDW